MSQPPSYGLACFRVIHAPGLKPSSTYTSVARWPDLAVNVAVMFFIPDEGRASNLARGNSALP